MRTLRFILAEYRANFRWFVIGMTALVIGALLQTVAPLYIKLAVDAASPEGFVIEPNLASTVALALLPLPLERSESFVLACLGMVALISIGIALATFYKRYYLVRISRRTEYDLRNRMYVRLQDMPAAWFDQTRSGGVMSLMTSDIEAVRMMIGPAIMYIGGTVIMFPASIAIMLSLNWKLTLLALIPLAGLSAATLWFNPRVRRYSLASQEDLEQLSARAQENFAGARVVKAFSREEFEIAEMERLGDTYLHNKLGQARNQALFQSCIWGFSGLGVLIILYFGALEISAGRSSVGDMAAFLLYNLGLYWPMIALGWVTMLFVRASASLKRLDAMMDQPTDPSRVPGGESPLRLRGEIEFRGVGLRYTDHGEAALSGINFRVEPGRTLGIVGPVGSGKSSVANLLLRLIKPTQGDVLVDGKAIADYDAHALRARIGYVPQDSFLFSDTIASNVALRLPPDDPARDDRVRQAAKDAEFEEEVLALPHGYETMLGERGVNLSGGQKQRAAIARALAGNPDILVFDDCLSAVDTDTEERILRNLKQRTSGVSTVIIAQRISAVQHADEIIVLEQGRIIERGTDAELRAADGLYATLARRQELAASLA